MNSITKRKPLRLYRKIATFWSIFLLAVIACFVVPKYVSPVVPVMIFLFPKRPHLQLRFPKLNRLIWRIFWISGSAVLLSFLLSIVIPWTPPPIFKWLDMAIFAFACFTAATLFFYVLVGDALAFRRSHRKHRHLTPATS